MSLVGIFPGGRVIFKSEWQRLEQALADEQAPLIIMGDFNNPENTLGHDLVLASPLGLKR